MGKYFVGHNRKPIMVVLPDITLLQVSFFDIRMKEKRFKRKEIQRNVQDNSGECSRRFRGKFEKIGWNVRKGSRERSRRFRGIFKKIPGNVRKESEE